MSFVSLGFQNYRLRSSPQQTQSLFFSHLAKENQGGSPAWVLSDSIAKDVVAEYESPWWTAAKKANESTLSQLTAARKTRATSTATATSSSAMCILRHRWTGRFEAHLWDKSNWNHNQNKKGKQGKLALRLRISLSHLSNHLSLPSLPVSPSLGSLAHSLSTKISRNSEMEKLTEKLEGRNSIMSSSVDLRVFYWGNVRT